MKHYRPHEALAPFLGQTTTDSAGNHDYSDLFELSHGRGGSDDEGNESDSRS